MQGQRLSAQDAMFLSLEGPSSPMHGAGIVILDGGPLSHQDALDAIGTKLDQKPRFRHRLAPVPMRLGRAVWVDDPSFDLGYHVRHVALPNPRGETELLRLAERLIETPLDRSKPLWEMYAVESLADGGAAVIRKIHHCIHDGVAAANNAVQELDLTPDVPDAEPSTWDPQPPPSRGKLAVDAIRERSAAIRTWRRRERTQRRSAGEVARNLAALGRTLRERAPRTPLDVTDHGPHRRIAIASASLDEVKHIRRMLGGTVNDVILTAVGGALGRWLERRGEQCDGVVLKAAVPANTRQAGEEQLQGNRVGAMVGLLPVGERDPAKRLRDVKAAMDAAKASRQAAATDMLARVAPPSVLAMALKLQSKARLFNVGVTNVPGPQFPLYWRGRRVLALYPLAPLLVPNLALTIAIISYDGQVFFGLNADADVVGDIDVIASGLRESMDELVKAASERSGEAPHEA